MIISSYPLLVTGRKVPCVQHKHIPFQGTLSLRWLTQRRIKSQNTGFKRRRSQSTLSWNKCLAGTLGTCCLLAKLQKTGLLL